MFLAQRHRLLDPPAEHATVAEEEEQQVEHDAEADDEVEGVLADAERLGRHHLAGLHRHRGELLLQAREIGQVEALQPLVHRWRQGSHRLLQVGGEVQFAGLDPLVDARAFLHQRTGDEDHRDDHDQHADQQGDQRGEVLPIPQAHLQAALHRGEDDRQDGAPEHRAVERQQEPAEGERDHRQQQEKSPGFQFRVEHVQSIWQWEAKH